MTLRIRIVGQGTRLFGWAELFGQFYGASIELPPVVPTKPADRARDLTSSIDDVSRAITLLVRDATGLVPVYTPLKVTP